MSDHGSEPNSYKSPSQIGSITNGIGLNIKKSDNRLMEPVDIDVSTLEKLSSLSLNFIFTDEW